MALPRGPGAPTVGRARAAAAGLPAVGDVHAGPRFPSEKKEKNRARGSAPVDVGVRWQIAEDVCKARLLVGTGTAVQEVVCPAPCVDGVVRCTVTWGRTTTPVGSSAATEAGPADEVRYAIGGVLLGDQRSHEHAVDGPPRELF